MARGEEAGAGKWCCPSGVSASSLRPPPPRFRSQRSPHWGSFLARSRYTTSRIPTLAASPNQRTTWQRTGAVVKRLWVEGQRRGISATEMPGFDSWSAKQNFHKIKKVFVTETHLLSTGEGGWAVSFFFF